MQDSARCGRIAAFKAGLRAALRALRSHPKR